MILAIIFLMAIFFQGSVKCRQYERVYERCSISFIGIFDRNSQMKCAQLCDITTDCSAFCFDVVTNTCSFYKMVDMGEGTAEFGLRSYKLFSSAKSHAGAIAHCASIGSHLALPMNSEQNAAVASLAQGSYWLGAEDIATEMSFVVSETGEPVTYFNWHPNEPSSDNEDCVNGYHNGAWNDYVCSNVLPFVCQYPPPHVCTLVTQNIPNDFKCYKRSRRDL